MGLFKKIKKGVGDVVDGVVGGVDKILGKVGINLSKILDNKWVQRGMMAAAIFTGGVAIANGVMTGYTSATAAQAAQQTVAGAAKSTFMDTFIAGGKGFIEGVASGLANPLDTAGELYGQASSAMSGLGGGAEALGGGAPSGLQSPADMVASAGDAGGQSAAGAMNAGAPPGAVTEASGALPNAIEANRPDFLGGGQVVDNTAAGMANAGAAPGTSPYGFEQMADTGGMGIGGPDALAQAGQAGEKGWLESLASGAKDFATSPSGMMMGANALQGWAQGSMVQERWDQMEKADKRRRKSWTGGNLETPSYDIPSLQNLRERTAKLRERGNQAQSKYGYGS